MRTALVIAAVAAALLHAEPAGCFGCDGAKCTSAGGCFMPCLCLVGKNGHGFCIAPPRTR
jgi:hypothetical protein